MGGERDGPGGLILSHELFTGIAKKHGCSSGVVSLSWAVQRGITVIPKSMSKARVVENIRLVTLTDEEMALINDAHNTLQRYRIADKIGDLIVEMDGKRTLQGWSCEDFGWEDEQGNWLT